MKKRSMPSSNIGSVTLLMTFIALCLVIFAILSLSSSLGEYHYSAKLAENNQAYYTASSEAEHTLADIDRILESDYTEDANVYYTQVAADLDTELSQDTDFSAKTGLLSFRVPINDTQALDVTLKLNTGSDAADGYYTVTQWQKVSTTDWEADESMNLMQ